MSKMRTLVGRAPAFFIPEAGGPEDLVTFERAMAAAILAPHCLLTPDAESCKRTVVFAGERVRVPDGWTLVGMADVKFQIVGERELVGNKVKSLQAQERRLMAESEARLTEIRAKIQTLLAIDYAVSEVRE
jgi:hypothetical protein